MKRDPRIKHCCDEVERSIIWHNNPEQLDTIFKQELAKYKYKPNWEFFANAFFGLRFRGGYGFRITEQPNPRQPPVIRNFERVQFQSNLAYNNELIQPPKVNDYGT